MAIKCTGLDIIVTNPDDVRFLKAQAGDSDRSRWAYEGILRGHFARALNLEFKVQYTDGKMWRDGYAHGLKFEQNAQGEQCFMYFSATKGGFEKLSQLAQRSFLTPDADVNDQDLARVVRINLLHHARKQRQFDPSLAVVPSYWTI